MTAPAHRRHYPNHQANRRLSNQVCNALQLLTGKNIEVVRIDLTGAMAVIEVFNCPANKDLEPETVGRGCNGEPTEYINKAAMVFGCKVIWSEGL